MALNFPHNPSTNDIYTAGGASYKWDGTVWKKAEESGTIDLLPSRVILMYSGTTAPSGFVLCDNSTAAQNANAPDLRNKFIVGSGNTYSLNATGGTADATVLVQHSHDLPKIRLNPGNDSQVNITLGSGQSYSIGYSSSAISNQINTQNASSGSATNANLPPYYALCFIMKL